MKKVLIKNFILINIIFLMTIITCLIPRSAIINNLQRSANYWVENDIYYRKPLINNIKGTTDDITADAIILSMIHEIDSEHPVLSATNFWHYSITGAQLEPTFHDNYVPDNTIFTKGYYDYYRYWHSYIIPLRILFVFFTLNQIKIIYFLIYLLLNYFLIKELYKNKMNSMIPIYLISSFLTCFHLTAISLEYMPAVYIILISSIYMLKQNEFDWKKFIIIGSMTCMFDFLTIETACFGIPLLFILEKLRRKNIFISIKEFVLSGISFVSGYGITYLYRWLLASIILKKNCFLEAIEKASVRTSKMEILDDKSNCVEIGLFKTSYMNLEALFPFETNWFFILCFLTLVICSTIIMLILFKKETTNKNYCFIFTFLIILPYIRYILLQNHSYIHDFFTFRAQIISIMALLMIWTHNIDWKKIRTKEG